MKRNIKRAGAMVCGCIAVVLMGCRGGHAEVLPAADTLTLERLTDTLETTVESVKCQSVADVDFPQRGDEALLTAIREWLCDLMELPDTADLADARTMTKLYHQAVVQSMEGDVRDYVGYLSPSVEGISAQFRVRRVYDGPQLVTFEAERSRSLSGQHSDVVRQGQTFRRADGRMFGWNMFAVNQTDSLRRMLREALEEHLDASGWAELQGRLRLDGFSRAAEMVPLPATQPYVVADSVQFVYQLYEIGPYSIGAPTVRLALSDVWPLLAPSFRRGMNNQQ